MTTRQRRHFLKQALETGTAPEQSQLWGLEGSASLHGKRLVLTAVNPSATEGRDAEISVRGARIESARAVVLSGDRLQAHNSFDLPDAVRPKTGEPKPTAGRLAYSFPRASVVRLTCELA